ncbi:hypothetical protein [Streptomyces roseochromogenus]|uniref:Uncharacterized protein n=1 Tax=Streptomyces roseochromogenus subsp. oscitans DS 12.976 TaxID=1352936 RepID=V6KTM7_STRRC|nr:hypothetical protein [Streptomyces roseochromogenus]EST35492.1 hypothetical protein M878_05375 [Streptomyces roseochromogenus subsp. oscitans DS 12.976]
MKLRKRLASSAAALGLATAGVVGVGATAVPASATAHSDTTSAAPVSSMVATQAPVKHVNGSPNPKAAFRALSNKVQTTSAHQKAILGGLTVRYEKVSLVSLPAATRAALRRRRRT